MVLGYLRRLVPRDEAEDVLRRTFVEVWRSRDRYDPSSSLEAWVLSIARKRAIDHLRRRRAEVVSIDELREVVGEDGRVLADRFARAAQVREALERLPREQREVLALAYFGDYTQTEVADRLDLPLGTVKARTFRGLKRLAAILARSDCLGVSRRDRSWLVDERRQAGAGDPGPPGWPASVASSTPRTRSCWPSWTIWSVPPPAGQVASGSATSTARPQVRQVPWPGGSTTSRRAPSRGVPVAASSKQPRTDPAV
jgi:RNA polymerase sigma-70 factor (ECF subfamily)